MNFSTTDLTAMLDAVGETVTIAGNPTTADFRLDGQLVQMFSGNVESIRPVCRVTPAQVSRYAIAHGTTIIVRGVTYTVVEVTPEQSGFIRLGLSL